MALNSSDLAGADFDRLGPRWSELLGRVSRCLDTRPLLEPFVFLAAIGGKIVPKNGNIAVGVDGGFAADRSAVIGHPRGAGGAFKALVDSLEPAGMDFVRFDIGVAFDNLAADVAAVDADKVLGVAGASARTTTSCRPLPTGTVQSLIGSQRRPRCASRIGITMPSLCCGCPCLRSWASVAMAPHTPLGVIASQRLRAGRPVTALVGRVEHL